MKREGEDGMEWWNPVARRCLEMTLLALVGGWAYFANLHLSLLEGAKGCMPALWRDGAPA